jgi:hypothetical protein
MLPISVDLSLQSSSGLPPGSAMQSAPLLTT